MTQSLLGEVLMRPGVDRILEILRNRQRRIVLIELWEGRADGVSDVLLRGEDARMATLELKHNHLLRLAEVGYVRWSRETGRISKGPAFDEVEPLLELLGEHADELPADWPETTTTV